MRSESSGGSCNKDISPAGKRSRSAGIRDVAKLAGVSISTVSRVLNNFHAVDAEVRQRVRDAVRALHYVPHSAARALSRRRSHTIGIVIPTIEDSIFAAQVAALQARAAELGYSVLIALSGFDLDVELQACKDLIESGVEGIMLVGGWHRKELYEILRARGIVYVHTSAYDKSSSHPSIGFDNIAAAELATNHLIQLGHRRIGFLSTIQKDNDRASLRFVGFKRALKAASLRLNKNWVVECRTSIALARKGFAMLVKEDARPSAIVCHNDVMAFGAILEAADIGIKVPHDISIVGFDDLEWASHIRPSLTTIRIAWAQMASLACDYLVNTLDGMPTTHSKHITTELIIRQSAAFYNSDKIRPDRR